MICNDDRPCSESGRGYRIVAGVRVRVREGDERVGRMSIFVGESSVLMCGGRELLDNRVSRGGRRILGV